MKRSLPNGPLRVQSKEFIKEVCKISDWILIYNSEYSVTWRHTSVAGDMIVSRKERAYAVKQGGTAGILPVLGRLLFCRGRFFIPGRTG